MQIIIDIPKEEYEYAKEHDDALQWHDPQVLILNAIRNGIPLPDGQGNHDIAKAPTIIEAADGDEWIDEVVDKMKNKHLMVPSEVEYDSSFD